MRVKLFLCGAITAIVLLCGCATIVTGSNKDIKINAREPASAEFSVTGSNGKIFYEGKAPVTLKLPKKYSYTVKVTMKGYETQYIYINQTFNAWVLGNICCAGIFLGGAIDLLTGAAWDLQPEEINITMVTAMNGTEDDILAVFTAFDDEGQLRRLVVPMIKTSA